MNKNCKIFMVALLVITSSGCASSLSTLRTGDPSIKTRYYKVSYNTAINAACEAASKVPDWKVQDVDEVTGIITVGESKNIWRYYVIKIFVRKIESGVMGIDIKVSHSADWLSYNKQYVLAFYDKLDDILKNNKLK